MRNMKSSIILSLLLVPTAHAFVTARTASFARWSHRWPTTTTPPEFVTACTPLLLEASTSIQTHTTLSLFGGLFGGNDSDDDDELNKELAVHKNIPGDFDAISDYIRVWSQRFESDKSLTTTRTKIIPSVPAKEESTSEDRAFGMKILFQGNKVAKGYTEKDREKARENSRRGEKKKSASEGGVEVIVEKLAGSTSVQVRALRCDMEDDTMVKEMSEEVILSELKKAMEAWKKK